MTDLRKLLGGISAKLGPPPAGPVVEESQKEYKIITQKDKWFSGKFDPEKVEGVLNSYATQGWTLKGVATASMPGLLGRDRDEIILIIER